MSNKKYKEANPPYKVAILKNNLKRGGKLKHKFKRGYLNFLLTLFTPTEIKNHMISIEYYKIRKRIFRYKNYRLIRKQIKNRR